MAVEPVTSPPGTRDQQRVPGPALPRDDVDAPALAALGLGHSAERVYRTLLAHGPATPARLADVARTDVAAVAAALAELASLDLAHSGAAGPGPAAEGQRYWSAAPPGPALAALVAGRQEALRERRRDLERAERAVDELVRRSRPAGRREGTDPVEVLAGAERIRQRAQLLAATARQHVLALDPAPCGTWHPDLRDLVRHGVRVRVVCERPGPFAGEDARTLAALPVRLVVADRDAAVVQLGADGGEPTALAVPPSALLTGLLLLFDTVWERAAPVPDRGAEGDEVLLALLAAGFKDESIARHLGISTSTVTRRMARLMERTGTSTRFQLGMQAVRRRWI